MQTNEIIALIRQAFASVKLEEGIGLREADAIDDYASDAERARCRAQDEKENWEAIRSEDLNRYACSLSYFDAKGMRFHLPAFMIAELSGTYHQGMAFVLTYLSDYTRAQFALFNLAQRQAVRRFLLWLKEQPDYAFEQPQIEQALENYWV